MDTTRIVDAIRFGNGMPEAAVHAAAARRDEVVPALVAALEQRLAALETGGDEPDADGGLFCLFHLMGSLRVTEAYRPLCRLLQRPEIDDILGDAISETTHRVMAAVFDGDLAPLQAVIENADAGEGVRSRLLEALAMLTRDGTVPRSETERYLRDCFTLLRPQQTNFVWKGWQSAIAMLGLADLSPLVRSAFEREFIDPTWMGYHHFEEDLAAWTSHPAGLTDADVAEYSVFGDFVEEMAIWPGLSADPREESAGDAVDADEFPSWDEGMPAYNPYRHVSRNDPCPCGSGKKFKRCCLA
jgi:hypothetical protein